MSVTIRALATVAAGGALALALAAPAAADYGQTSASHELTADCGEVTLTFVNPTVGNFSGDYRVGDEAGTPDQFSEIIPNEGPWAGMKLGDRYNRVSLPAGATVPVVVPVTEDTTVSYWVNRGPENRSYTGIETVEVTACEDDDDGNGDGNGDDKPTYRDSAVTFADECDGVSGEVAFGDRKGSYKYSIWHDGEFVEKVSGERDGTESWNAAEADEVRVTVDHKAKGKKAKWTNVLDVTHAHTAPEGCDDDDVVVPDPDETGKPDDTDTGEQGGDGSGKGEDTPAQGDASNAGDSLPVTGGALAGLVAAAVAAVGAGGAGLYLARKRKATATEDE